MLGNLINKNSEFVNEGLFNFELDKYFHYCPIKNKVEA